VRLDLLAFRHPQCEGMFTSVLLSRSIQSEFNTFFFIPAFTEILPFRINALDQILLKFLLSLQLLFPFYGTFNVR